VSSVVTRITGPRRSSKQSSTTRAAISLAALQVRVAGSTTTRRPVRLTDS
jgi:hypothetical protein